MSNFYVLLHNSMYYYNSFRVDRCWQHPLFPFERCGLDRLSNLPTITQVNGGRGFEARKPNLIGHAANHEDALLGIELVDAFVASIPLKQ